MRISISIDNFNLSIVYLPFKKIHKDNAHIKITGNWHHKGEFAPAIKLQVKKKLKDMADEIISKQ